MLDCPECAKPVSLPISKLLNSEGTMAKTEHAALCLLLVLATFAQCVLGQIGYTYVHNSASFDIAHTKQVTHADGSNTMIADSTLAQGTTEVFQIPLDVTCVSTSYLQLPAKNVGQVVLDWCETGMRVACLPDCFWIIDETGFSVTNNKYGTLQFVAGWKQMDEHL